MEPLYSPEGVEERWQRTWEEEGLYNADPDPSRESFAIAHPPPNVTGDLHLGHALQLSLADTIVRTRRMQGFNVLFQPGYDHAGHLHPERGREAPRRAGEIAAGPRPRGVRRARLGVAPRVRRQDHVPVPPDRRLARLPPRAVHDGRGVRPRGDALLRPPLGEGLDLPGEPDRQLVPVPPDLALRPRARARRTSTTRSPTSATRSPTATGTSRSRPRGWRRSPPTSRSPSIPDDERYRDAGRARGGRALGRAARAGDRRRAGRARLRHRRAEGHARPRPEGLRDRPRPRPAGADRDRPGRPDERPRRAGSTGLTQEEAEERILAWLRERDQLEKRESYRHTVALCDRCKNRIEPLISPQWWCSMEELKRPALEALRSGRVRFHPESQHRFAIASLEEAPDWNISRQIWWGHQLPLWQCPDGHWTCAEEEPDACAECGSGELTRSEDVLDTWFSSALWPFATLGWPDDTEDLRAFYPGDLNTTARDIIRLWENRMIFAGLELMGDVPFSRRRHPLARARADGRPDVEEPRHRDEPARADRALRRRRDPLRADEDGLVAGRDLLGGRDRGGAEAREEALERSRRC